MNDDTQQGRSIEDRNCAYCGSKLTATTPICFACGMPRFQTGRGTGSLPIPPPRPSTPQKAYVPDAQQFAAIPDVPYETVPPPTFGQPPAAESSTVLASVSRETWSRVFRSAAAVVTIAVLAFAVVFGVGKVWQARNEVHVDFKEVRTKLDDIRREYVTPSHESNIPRYTVTRTSRSGSVRRVAVTQPDLPMVSPVVRKAGGMMEVQAAQTSPAPAACGPGTMQVSISPTSPAPVAAPANPRN